MSSPKKNNNNDDAPPMIRTLTQAETLNDAKSFFDNLGGAPETRLRQNPKRTNKYELVHDEEKDEVGEDEDYGKKKTTPKSYLKLAIEAIQKLANKNGSSFVAICRYIEKNYDVSSRFATYVEKSLDKAVEEGNIIKNKRSFLLSDNYKPVSRSPSPNRKSPSKSNRSPSPQPKRNTTTTTRSKSKSPSPSSSKKKKTADKPNKSPSSKKIKVSDNKLKRTPSTTIKSGPKLKKANENQDPIEIIFSFDTTGSMSAYLEEVQKKLAEMVNELMDNISGLKIGLIAHGDYCDEMYGYVLIKHDFSDDVHALSKWINEVKETAGGDIPECYEYALQEAKNFNWSEKSTRVLVVIGDAYPHSPEESEKKIDWREELKQLIEKDVRVYGVQVADDQNATKFFEEISEESYGTHLRLQQFSQLKELMLGLCYREAAEIHYKKNEEVINNLEKGESAKLLLPETEDKDDKDYGLSEENILKIHQAIHDKDSKQIEVEGNSYDIAIGKAGCRFVKVKGLTFIEQNKEKDNKYARMAIEGKLITWIVRKGKWGLIVDNKIEN